MYRPIEAVASRRNVLSQLPLPRSSCAGPFDPANLMVELRFLTNRAIVPWVAPELRIHQAIRRHYGIDWHPGSVPLADYDPKLHLPTPNGVARGDDA